MYTPRHAAPPTVEDLHNVYDPADSRDRYEVEEIEDVLRSMPLRGEEFGDGGAADWTLSILIYLAGWGDEDSWGYLGPRVEAAARTLLAEVGCPGDAFAGLVTR